MHKSEAGWRSFLLGLFAQRVFLCRRFEVPSSRPDIGEQPLHRGEGTGTGRGLAAALALPSLLLQLVPGTGRWQAATPSSPWTLAASLPASPGTRSASSSLLELVTLCTIVLPDGN